MRLVNARTLQLEEFVDVRSAPKYYILSHCWGEGEVSYKEFRKGLKHDSEGYAKVKDYCAFAIARWESRVSNPGTQEFRRVGPYVWIDTCCIDKRSSAELSEAINSMYQWYGSAIECHAYLRDVEVTASARDFDHHFCNSRWFKRGWTLQELLAPERVIFLNKSWKPLGCKCRWNENLKDENNVRGNRNALVMSITGIEAEYLNGARPSSAASVACKMSWAAHRQTTRIEDQAYCLMGLFGVNMPLLYGEGERAFMRLQEEIMRTSADMSLFAWQSPSRSIFSNEVRRIRVTGLLAKDPSQFSGCGLIVRCQKPKTHYAMTNIGVQIHGDFQEGVISRKALGKAASLNVYRLSLNCKKESEDMAIYLVQLRDNWRRAHFALEKLSALKIHDSGLKRSIYAQAGYSASRLWV